MLFNDLGYEWLESRKPFVKSRTYETYYGTFINQVEPFFKNVQCHQINEQMLDKYSIAVQTSELNRFNRRPSRTVASKAFQVIKSIIYYGQRYRKIRYFTYHFQYVKTGLRIGEVCGLKWESLDFNKYTIKIICTAGLLYNHCEKTEKVHVTSPKTNKSQRVVYAPAVLMKYLQQFQSEHNVDGYIFQRYKDFHDGQSYELPMRQDMMRRRFNTLMKHLEIYDVHFHTLRHTFATQAIEEGINPKTVSELLGHSSVSITLNRYVHPSEDEKRKCMNIYSSLL